jgi:hypothetical protein
MDQEALVVTEGLMAMLGGNCPKEDS